MSVETYINEILNLQSMSSSCKSDGCKGQTVYGLKILSSEEIIFQISDISSNEIDVLRLISLLKEQRVTLDQLPYIIEDYVQSLYM